MNTPKCLRYGGQDFNEREQHHYIDSEKLNEENKKTHTLDN